MAGRKSGFRGGKTIAAITGSGGRSPKSGSGPKKVGKVFNTLMRRGEKAANAGDRSGTATPKAFRGGKQIVKYPNASRRKGSGANVGAGTTTSSDI